MTDYYLYAVACPALDGTLIKIGIADHIEKRVRSLQTGCPRPIEILATWRYSACVWARHAEKECHRRFEKFNTHGEWFKIPLESVVSFLKEYNNDDRLGRGERVVVGDIRMQRKAADRLVKPTPRRERQPRKIMKRAKTIPKDVAAQILAHKKSLQA